MQLPSIVREAAVRLPDHPALHESVYSSYAGDLDLDFGADARILECGSQHGLLTRLACRVETRPQDLFSQREPPEDRSQIVLPDPAEMQRILNRRECMVRMIAPNDLPERVDDTDPVLVAVGGINQVTPMKHGAVPVARGQGARAIVRASRTREIAR